MTSGLSLISRCPIVQCPNVRFPSCQTSHELPSRAITKKPIPKSLKVVIRVDAQLQYQSPLGSPRHSPTVTANHHVSTKALNIDQVGVLTCQSFTFDLIDHSLNKNIGGPLMNVMAQLK
jgi:hypothetical protein